MKNFFKLCLWRMPASIHALFQRITGRQIARTVRTNRVIILPKSKNDQ